jgi:hypothetical protein
MLLQAAKDGKLEIYTATLTVAECQRAEEPSTTGMPADDVKTLFKKFLTSGQYLSLIQDTILVAEQAGNLRWVHGICLSGPDSIHVASYMELKCDEFLRFDTAFHKKKAQLDNVAVKVRMPRTSAERVSPISNYWRKPMKPALPPIDVPGSTPFQKMDNLFRTVIAVPKAEIDRREEQWKREHGKPRKKNRRKSP